MTQAVKQGSVEFHDKAIEFAKEATGIDNPVEACEALSIACFMVYLDPQKLVDLIPKGN